MRACLQGAIVLAHIKHDNFSGQHTGIWDWNYTYTSNSAYSYFVRKLKLEEGIYVILFHPLTDKQHHAYWSWVLTYEKADENVSQRVPTLDVCSSPSTLFRQETSNRPENAPLFWLTHNLFRPRQNLPFPSQTVEKSIPIIFFQYVIHTCLSPSLCTSVEVSKIPQIMLFPLCRLLMPRIK